MPASSSHAPGRSPSDAPAGPAAGLRRTTARSASSLRASSAPISAVSRPTATTTVASSHPPYRPSGPASRARSAASRRSGSRSRNAATLPAPPGLPAFAAPPAGLVTSHPLSDAWNLNRRYPLRLSPRSPSVIPILARMFDRPSISLSLDHLFAKNEHAAAPGPASRPCPADQRSTGQGLNPAVAVEMLFGLLAAQSAFVPALAAIRELYLRLANTDRAEVAPETLPNIQPGNRPSDDHPLDLRRA